MALFHLLLLHLKQSRNEGTVLRLQRQMSFTVYLSSEVQAQARKNTDLAFNHTIWFIQSNSLLPEEGTPVSCMLTSILSC